MNERTWHKNIRVCIRVAYADMLISGVLIFVYTLI